MQRTRIQPSSSSSIFFLRNWSLGRYLSPKQNYIVQQMNRAIVKAWEAKHINQYRLVHTSQGFEINSYNNYFKNKPIIYLKINLCLVRTTRSRMKRTLDHIHICIPQQYITAYTRILSALRLTSIRLTIFLSKTLSVL